MMLANLYDALNRIVGNPAVVDGQGYNHDEIVFEQDVVKLLQEISEYVARDAHVLIIGCGNGFEIDWFARRCSRVTAVDVNPEAVDQSRKRSHGADNVACHVVDDRTLPFANEEFDLIFMHDVCEHLLRPEEVFMEYFRVLKPGKALVNSFAPLFYSPYGAHLHRALKLPWGHLIFGLRAVVEIRNRYYPGHADARAWGGLGLNRITERRYQKIIRRAGFSRKSYELRTSKGLPLVSRIPFLRNLFIAGIKDVLVKPS